MITREIRIYPTPADGVRAEIVYLDAHGNAVDKEVATGAIIRELDHQGRIISETFGNLGAKKGVS